MFFIPKSDPKAQKQPWKYKSSWSSGKLPDVRLKSSKFITTFVLLLNVTLKACKASELKKFRTSGKNRKSGKIFDAKVAWH